MSVFAFDSRGLLLFIAILHFTEAILVRLSGSLQAMPVYSRNEKGILTVKTQFERIWPVPLVFPVPTGPISMTALYSGYLVMPERWPLIHTIGNIETAVIYQLVPVLAMIGYRDMAEPGRERVQVCKSAGLLLCYSGILCFFVWVSSSRQPMLVVAALFAILGHEGILWIGRISMRKYVHSKKE